MANYILKANNQLLKAGNYILTSSDEVPPPVFDLNPALWNLENGAKISQQTDIVGNRVIQVTPAAQPVIINNDINGLPAIYLDGTDDFLNINVPFFPKTLFILVKQRETRSGQFYPSLFNDEYYLGGGDQVGGNIYFSSFGSRFANQVQNRVWVGNIKTTMGALNRTNFYKLITIDCVDSRTIHTLFQATNTGQLSVGYPNYNVARLIAYDRRLTELQRVTKMNELLTLYNL